MADTASLVVRVKSQGVNVVNREMAALTGVATKAASAVAGFVSVTAGVNKLVQVSRQTDVLNASLLTMTGSMSNANMVFSELANFAATTPYALDQSVTAFTRLVSLGLNPSQKALTSYGNTAAAMGKDLNQMIEAVADATTFEFERLKEFGIRASQQGNQIAFTFQGVTTTVEKNSQAIQAYLQGIGENNFAGAMANRMATLDGALSNLQDTWDGLFRAISAAGTGDAIAVQVRAATDALASLTDSISSGQALGYINAWGSQWESTAEDIKAAIKGVDDYLTSTLEYWGLSAEESSNLMSDAFWQFPTNIRTLIQVATVEIAGFVDKAAVYAKMIDAYLTPENWFSDVDIADYYGKQLAQIDANVLATTSGFLDERDKRVNKLKQEKDAADALRDSYDAQQKAAKPIDLGQFARAPEANQAPVATQQQQQQAQAYLLQLQQSNMSELQLIDSQEQEKIKRTDEYRKQGLLSEQQYQDALTQIQTNAVLARAEYANAQLDEQSKQRDESRKADLSAAAEQKRQRQKTIDDGIDGWRNMTSNLKSTLGEQSSIYKASAIAMATIDTYKAATGAYAAMASIPVVGPALGIAAAAAAITAGLAQVAAIKGAREQGGYMSAGSAYQMAERGKAEVIVPSGNSRAKTIQQMRDMMGAANDSRGNAPITIINQTTGRIDEVEQQQMDDGQLRIIVREVVSQDMLTQDSQIAKARAASRGQPGF
jgi:hypothetical protein